MSVVLFCLFPFGFCLKKTILGTERKSRQLNSWFFQLYFEVGYLYKNQTPFINFWFFLEFLILQIFNQLNYSFISNVLAEVGWGRGEKGQS